MIPKIVIKTGGRNDSSLLKTIFKEHLIPFVLFRMQGELYLRVDGGYVSPEPIVYDFAREVNHRPQEFVCWGMVRMDHNDILLGVACCQEGSGNLQHPELTAQVNNLLEI